VAVHENSEEDISYALLRLGICYYYQGNITKSRQYSVLADAGLSPLERDNIRVNFCNESRIFDLERTLSNELDFKDHYICEHEPSHLDGLVAPPEVTKWLGKIRKSPYFPNQKAKESDGSNSSQVFRMHKSYNRCW
jgi:hypothetical protein